MKILLVQPATPPSFWSMAHEIRFAGKDAVMPPLGLLTVAALLPEAWEKRLVDLTLDDLRDEDLRWADLVFLGGMNIHERSVREVLAQCRQVGCTVVGGGPLFTHEHHRFEGVDHFVLNEAEITLPWFLKDLEAGEPKALYTTPEKADVRQTPVPLWELADLDRYSTTVVQYSRGCPFQCDFCDVTALFGRRPRTKTAEQIIRELEAVPDLDRFAAVFVADDNLIGNKRDLKRDLLPALAAWQRSRRRKIWFMTQLTVTLADDDELIEMMTDAGFGTVFVGIETPEEAALLASKKKQNLGRDLIADVQHLHRSGLEVWAGFIVGFDTDEPSIFDRQIAFIQQSGVLSCMVSMLNAPPGTELHERMKREGRLLEHVWELESTTNLVPTMGFETLHAGYERILRHIWDPKHLYERAKRFLTDYRLPGSPGLSQTLASVRPELLVALVRVVYRLGIRDEGRLYFWRLWLWCLLHRPSLLDKVPQLWARGYHFRTVAKDVLERNRSRDIGPTRMGNRKLPVLETLSAG